MNTKSWFFLRFARPYVARRLKRQFFDMRVSGLPRLRHMAFQGPLILACNHVAWWDPLLLVHLDSILGSDGYCLMDRRSLKQLPFFRWVGALPISQSSPKAAYRDLENAEKALLKPGQIVAIFPQGEQRPAHLPLALKPGVAALAERSRAPVVPCAIRYDFLESPRQVIHMKFGEPLVCDARPNAKVEFLTALTERIQDALTAIDVELATQGGEFESVFRKKRLNSGTERIPLSAAALRALTGSDAHD